MADAVKTTSEFKLHKYLLTMLTSSSIFARVWTDFSKLYFKKERLCDVEKFEQVEGIGQKLVLATLTCSPCYWGLLLGVSAWIDLQKNKRSISVGESYAY